jgi:four helix bundle protein
MKNFRELKVWQLGMRIVKEVYSSSTLIPEKEKYGLISQITRAAVSIRSNIAEGSSRASDRDNRRFLEIALGSSFELQTQLLILEEINYLKSEKTKSLLEMITEEQKMIRGFIKRLQAND